MCNLQKLFSPVCMLLVQLASINVFILSDNCKTLLSVKVYRLLLWDFFNRHVAFFGVSVLKEVRILCVIPAVSVQGQYRSAKVKLIMPLIFCNQFFLCDSFRFFVTNWIFLYKLQTSLEACCFITGVLYFNHSHKK